MPIHYACILNARNNVVLQGVYESTQTIFKSQILQNSRIITRFQFKEATISDGLRVLYWNWDTITAAIVIDNVVDK